LICPAAEPYVLGGGYSLDPPVQDNLSLFSVSSSNPYALLFANAFRMVEIGRDVLVCPLVR
jgi:hypothetical protein